MAGPLRAWLSVFCFALGAAGVGCVGGPISDYPSRANDDDDDEAEEDDDAPPPQGGALDAGSVGGLDAGVPSSTNGDGAASCGEADSSVDGSLLGMQPCTDAGTHGDAAVGLDAGITPSH